MMPEIIKQNYHCGSLSGECLVLKNDNLPWLIIHVSDTDLLWELYCKRWLVTTTPEKRELTLEPLDTLLDTTRLTFTYWQTTPETAVKDVLTLNNSLMSFKETLK